MNGKQYFSRTDEDILLTLTAISVVSRRMAKRIMRAMMTTKGGRADGQSERTERMRQRAAGL